MITLEDLNIGNFIECPDEKYRQIKELSETDSLLDWDDYGCTIEEIEPIIPNDYILELNKFIKKSYDLDDNIKIFEYTKTTENLETIKLKTPYEYKDDNYIIKKDGIWELNITGISSNIHILKNEPIYIHDIQNASRMCKIYDYFTL